MPGGLNVDNASDLGHRVGSRRDHGSKVDDRGRRESFDQFSVRIDENLTSHDQLFGRYSYSNEDLFAPGALTSQATRRQPRSQIATLGHTRIFGASTANDVRIGFTRLRLNIVNKNAFTTNIPQQLGIRVSLVPKKYTIPDLVDALVEHFSAPQPAVT